MPAYNYFPTAYYPMQYNGFNALPTQQNVGATQPTQSGIIWVSNDSEADAYPIAPNNAVVLWNRSSPVVYIKQADASGRPSLKSYDLVERTKLASGESSVSESNNAQYATKDEIEAMAAIVEAMKSDIKTLKKSMRKKVEDEDDE